MKLRFTSALLAVFFAFFSFATAQNKTLEILFSDPLEYPVVNTAFSLKADGTEIRSGYSSDNVIVEEWEYGQIVERNVLEVECPAMEETAFSAVLVVDISTSMSENVSESSSQAKIDVTKNVLKMFVQEMDPSRTEVAITAFCGDAMGLPINDPKPIRPYTTDKDALMYAIDNLPDLCSGTNWNAAFLHRNGFDWWEELSALHYCKPSVARYKPVIIFLTDGNHLPKWGGPVDYDQITLLAKQRNARIYVVQIGDEDITDDNQRAINYLAGVEGNSSDNQFLGITDADALETVYRDILQEAGEIGDPPPCHILWESGCEGGSATFTFLDHEGISATSEFELREDKKPYIEITPDVNYLFQDVAPGNSDTETLTLYARQNDLVIEGADMLNPIRAQGRYTIVDWGDQAPPPINLTEGEPYDIVVEYTPADENYSKATFELTGTACGGREFTVEGEMLPFLRDLDMGDVAINSSSSDTFTGLFCNKTGGAIRVNSASLEENDADNFELLSPTGSFEVDSGDCIEVSIRFSPIEPAGTKQTQLKFRTNYGNDRTFECTVTGNALGDKTMTHDSPGFDSTDCNNTTTETTIMLENSGNVEMGVTNCEILPDETNFGITSQCPPTIGAASQEPLTIEFHPSVFQNADHTATLRVESDAENSPYEIDLIGPMRNIAFSLPNNADFGEVCVGSPQNFTIDVTNDGNVGFMVDLAINAPFQPVNGSVYLPAGETVPVEIEFAPASDGSFDEELAVTDQECGYEETITVSGMGVYPSITLNPQINLSATIGDDASDQITLTNNSDSPLNIQSITPVDNVRFNVTNINPPLATDLAPGGTLTFTITYTPQTGDSDFLESGLQITGNTCNFDTTATITGNPGLATINIEIDEYTGFDGETKYIPVYLRNGNNFDQSNTTEITADIRYNGKLLESQNYTESAPDAQGFRTITLSNISVNPINTEQEIVEIEFLVKQTDPAVVSTPLEILNPTGDGGAQLIPDNGLFDLNPASAIISIDSVKAQPGENFKIPIRIRDAQNISDFNDSIKAKIRFNGTILEPRWEPDLIDKKSFDKDNGEWEITLRFPPNINNGILNELPVRAMLGSVTETSIAIDSLWLKVGGANLTAEPGHFALVGLCKDGEEDSTRLFKYNPNASAQIISIKPNPNEGTATIEYETSEVAQTTLWISDILGNRVKRIASGVLERGVKTAQFEAQELPDGVYFIILQTPTQIVREKIYILR